MISENDLGLLITLYSWTSGWITNKWTKLSLLCKMIWELYICHSNINWHTRENNVKSTYYYGWKETINMWIFYIILHVSWIVTPLPVCMGKTHDSYSIDLQKDCGFLTSNNPAFSQKNGRFWKEKQIYIFFRELLKSVFERFCETKMSHNKQVVRLNTYDAQQFLRSSETWNSSLWLKRCSVFDQFKTRIKVQKFFNSITVF